MATAGYPIGERIVAAQRVWWVYLANGWSNGWTGIGGPGGWTILDGCLTVGDLALCVCCDVIAFN